MNYKIIAKFIKDLTFRIPNSKTFLLLDKEIKNYKVNIDINSIKLKEKIIEIDIKLSLNPLKEVVDQIKAEIIYSTLIELDIKKKTKEELEQIILIEVPTIIYPEIRSNFIFAFEKSGFKEIRIDKEIDFRKLYSLRKTQK